MGTFSTPYHFGAAMEKKNRKKRSAGFGPTKRIAFKLSLLVIDEVLGEARRVNRYPSHVVEQRLRHSLRISASFPTDPAA